MITSVSKIAPSAAVGVLLGLLAIWWIEPSTAGGMGLLIVIGILATSIIHAIFSLFSKLSGS